MNISIGICQWLCQNENLVRMLNNFIDNIATPLPKKVNLRLIKKYRMISLISHLRIMFRVMLNGIKYMLAELLSEEQM